MAITASSILGIAMTLAQSASMTGSVSGATDEINAAVTDATLSTAQAHADAALGAPIVVLGARNGDLCVAPQVLQSRVDRAAQFARLHPANTIIVTGGETQAGCLTEAQTMEAMLRSKLVVNPIIRDDSAGSTVGNAAATRAITDRAVIVTSQDHMPRALQTFRDAGVHVSGVASA